VHRLSLRVRACGSTLLCSLDFTRARFQALSFH
jgi:hypothetical protein